MYYILRTFVSHYACCMTAPAHCQLNMFSLTSPRTDVALTIILVCSFGFWVPPLNLLPALLLPDRRGVRALWAFSGLLLFSSLLRGGAGITLVCYCVACTILGTVHC